MNASSSSVNNNNNNNSNRHPPMNIEELRNQIAADASHDERGPTMFWSPHELSHGKKIPLPMVHCDQTASNRPLQSIEKYLQRACLPFYGNTHTNTSVTGIKSTEFCVEARKLVAEAVNAKTTAGSTTSTSTTSSSSTQDVVLFAGSGSTSAVELLLDCLGFNHMDATASTKPIVFIGPFEHHSNLLPWRECGAKIVMIPELNGQVDMLAMELLLQKYQSSGDALKIGTFTAASNVTGAVTDTDAITAMLHKYRTLSIWDYATGAPYLNMDMNPKDDTRFSSDMTAKDALFFSPHKMIGGVSTPGVLVIKKKLVQTANPPKRAGGGTVEYVTQNRHSYLSDRIERYEGGTPNVAGIWRVGLTMLFKRQIQKEFAHLAEQEHGQQLEENKCDDADQNDIVLPKTIVPRSTLDCEYNTYDRVAATLSNIPNVALLGYGVDGSVKHLPIFSFLIKCGRRFLHYNYVCAVLNNVFGIQSRGGCQCAGPYSERLLGLTYIDESGAEVSGPATHQVEAMLVDPTVEAKLLKPGFTRLSLPFKGVSSLQAEYVVKAIEWVAQNGWALLPSYQCNHRTGEWRPRAATQTVHEISPSTLSQYSAMPTAANSEDSMSDAYFIAPSSWETTLEATIKTAAIILEQARESAADLVPLDLDMTDDAGWGMDKPEPAFEDLRWFVFPKEVAQFVSQGIVTEVPGTMERDNLLGAVRPTTWFPRKKPIQRGIFIESSLQAASVTKTEAVSPGPNITDKTGSLDSEDLSEDQLLTTRQQKGRTTLTWRFWTWKMCREDAATSTTRITRNKQTSY